MYILSLLTYQIIKGFAMRLQIINSFSLIFGLEWVYWMRKNTRLYPIIQSN